MASTKMCGRFQAGDIQGASVTGSVGDGSAGCEDECEGAIVDNKVCLNRLMDCTGGANNWCATLNETTYAVPSATNPKWCVSCEAETSLTLLILPPLGVLLLLCAVVCALLHLARKHRQSFRRWLTFASIIYYHCLTISQIIALEVKWPPRLLQLANLLSLERLLSLPDAECAIDND